MSHTLIPPEKLDALIMRLGGEERVDRFLRGEDVRWREEDGVIHLFVTSDGTTGPKWIKRLRARGFRVIEKAEDVLCSSSFKPTNGVTTEIVILKGKLFTDDCRNTNNIFAEATKRKLVKPSAEVVCLIRNNFSNDDISAMGLDRIVVMHEPIRDSAGDPFFLCVNREITYPCWNTIDVCIGRSNDWQKYVGLAFAVPSR